MYEGATKLRLLNESILCDEFAPKNRKQGRAGGDVWGSSSQAEMPV